MSKLGYRLTATLYTLNNEKIQTIKCKRNTKRYETSSFMGGGRLTQGQTLEIATRDVLDSKVVAGLTRCLFQGQYYLVSGRFKQIVAPLNQGKMEIADTILSLQ